MNRFFSLGSIEQQLGDDTIEGVCMSNARGRDGDIWEVANFDLENFRAFPCILRQHDPDRVVGSATAIGLVDSNTVGIRIQFTPLGVSAIADETRHLVKSGFLRGLSAGIEPDRQAIEPLRDGTGGLRIVRAELLEVSFTPIPADVNSRVTARSFAARPGAAAMLRTLPTVAASAIERAVSFARVAPVPLAALTPREQWEQDRRKHTLTAYALARAEADRLSYSQRQKALAELTRGD